MWLTFVLTSRQVVTSQVNLSKLERVYYKDEEDDDDNDGVIRWRSRCSTASIVAWRV